MRQNSWPILLITLIAVLLQGCTWFRYPIPTPTPDKFISESEATQAAVQWASSAHLLRFQGSLIPVTVVLAKFMTLADAVSFQWFPDCGLMNLDPSRYPNDRMVWAVLMDGRWPSGAPPIATPFPTFFPSTELVVMLDAATGDVIDVAVNSIQPTSFPMTEPPLGVFYFARWSWK
jgi:hypothetical protein